MKIVIATAVYYPMINGVAVFSHNLAVGLAGRGHEVLVLCPSQTGRSYTRMIDGVKTCYLKSSELKVYPDQIHKVPERRKFLGIRLPRLFYKNGFRISVFPKREISKILDDFQPDVVHVQVSDMIGMSVVSYAKKHKIPVVTTEHNRPDVLTDPLKLPKFLKKPAVSGLEKFFIWRHGKSDFVTMPTKLAIRELLRGREFKVPIAAVSNGVDLSSFKPGKALAEIYGRYKIPEGVPVALYVGRVDPEKNVGTVVSAFRKVLDKIPEAVLVVVGDGVDRLRLEAEAKRLGISGSVRFLGRVLPPDLYELYKVGDVFVTASEIETQGIVLIEAAATGLPLVAVDAGAVAEVCREGENGFLINKGGRGVKLETKIADAVSKILIDKELQKKFSANSIKIAHEHDFEKTLDQFTNIYNKVMKKPLQ
ncbi:MAG: glycosyltransferase [Candidatus Saccharibacteria bacterium]|nr:glycosyltransferase [Candidatus Saccharibacteria bacterium]